MDTHNNESVIVSEPSPNWPELLSKTVDDLTRIGRTEIELLETRLKRLLDAQVDNIAGILVLVVALAYGSLFLLGGLVLLIHLWLAWWLSFLIVGVVIALAGLAFKMRMAAAAKAQY
jgi:cobalamin biosynthesis protein CobD/CbiB